MRIDTDKALKWLDELREGVENSNNLAEEIVTRAMASSDMLKALTHAEAILTYTLFMSSNKGGKGPSTTTCIARDLVREAIAKANGETITTAAASEPASPETQR